MKKVEKIKTENIIHCNCTDCDGPRQEGPCLMDQKPEIKPTIRNRKKSNS
jgi:hypothetical protein